MDPFNIIITTDGRKIDLNIHPQEAGSYKIIYHGGLIGEIFMGSDGENWEAVSADDLMMEGFPVYEYDENSGHAPMLSDSGVVAQIGKKIREYQNLA